MNLTILFIFIVISTIIIDILTYKKDQFLEMKNKKIKRIINNYLSICLTYIIFTLLFSLLFKSFLVPEEYFTCNNICTITITNTLIGAIALILQLFNIYNFYDNYIYTYRFFASHSKNYEKILIFLIGIITILLNEFIISNINLKILVFDISLFNILIWLVIYSTFIFMTLLIIIREIKRIIRRKKEIEEEYY